MQALGGDTWLQGGLSGTKRTGGLTEAQLTDELGPDFLQLPIPRNASATISWWQVRQAAFNRNLQVTMPCAMAIVLKLLSNPFPGVKCTPCTFNMTTCLALLRVEATWDVFRCSSRMPVLLTRVSMLLQGKKARMQKQAVSNIDDISKLATKTMRDSKRKLPKLPSWSRTN